MPSSGHHTFVGLLIATPATRTASALTRAPGAFGRSLVRAQPEERPLAKLAVGGPLGVGELRDEPRPHPCRPADPRRRVERRAVRAEPRELRGERRERLPRIPGPDLADIAQTRALVETDQQRAKMLAAALRRRETADDDLRLLPDLHLPPRPR